MKKVLLAVIFLLIPIVSIGQENLCQVKISPSVKGRRNVLLMGGDAYTLFQSYVNQTKSANVKIDYTGIIVHFWDGSKIVSQQIGWFERAAKALLAKGVEDVWKERLSKRDAQYNEQELKKAYQLGWDIFCVGEQSQVKKGECSSEAKIHVDKGIIFMRTGDLDSATREFEYAIKVSPTCALAYGNLVSAHIAKNNYNLAIEIFNKGREKVGEDPFLYMRGTVAYIKNRQYDLALQTLEKTLSIKQKDETKFTESFYKSLKSGEFEPLIRERKRDFCDLVLRYSLSIIYNEKCK